MNGKNYCQWMLMQSQWYNLTLIEVVQSESVAAADHWQLQIFRESGICRNAGEEQGRA
jgi:hypothetical protein